MPNPQHIVERVLHYSFPQSAKDRLRTTLVDAGIATPDAASDAAWAQLREYFALHAFTRVGLGMPSVLVDWAWHSLLEDQEAYAEFCQQTLGEHVSHDPDPHAEPRLVVGPVREDVATTAWLYRDLAHRKAHPIFRMPIGGLPKLFSADADFGLPGWIWTREAYERACQQHELPAGVTTGPPAQAAAPKNERSNTRRRDDGGGCTGALLAIAGTPANAASGTCTPAAPSAPSGADADCGSSSSGSSCGSSCGGGCGGA